MVFRANVAANQAFSREQTAMRVPWEDQIEAFAIAMAMGWFYDTVFAQLGDLPE
jgi:hypothetical protein